MRTRLILIARENSDAVFTRIQKSLIEKKSFGGIEKKKQSFSLGAALYSKIIFSVENKTLVRGIVLGEANHLCAYAILGKELKPIKLVVLDTDSTFINEEVIDELAVYANVKEQVATITERAMRGELDFNEALKERVRLLKGLSENVFPEIFEKKLTYTRGAREFIEYLNSCGIFSYLVSGGFSYFTEKIVQNLKLTGQFANKLEVINGKLTGCTTGEVINREKKRQILKDLARMHGINLKEACAVGDGANDIDMLNTSGVGIAFCAKPALLKITFAAVFERNLRLVEQILNTISSV